MLQPTTTPLTPDISPNSILRRLTLESNAVIHALILGVLDEEGLDASWIASIKRALGDLGECVVSGQWLPGLQRARKAQNDARALQEKAARDRARKERDRLNESKVVKAKTSDKVDPKEPEIENTRSKEEWQSLVTKEVRALVSVPSTPTPTLSPKHLIITASFQFTELPDRDSDFDLIPASKQCNFLPDMYSFPYPEGEHEKPGEGGIVVCGLDTWNLDEEVKPRIIGGNFVFRNLTSATPQDSLAAVLRISIYTYLSLILEQDLLSDSHLTLQFPSPPPPPTSTSPLSTPRAMSPTQSPPKRKTRASKASSGIWSFLSKKTEGIFHRGIHKVDDADGHLPRTSYLDLGPDLFPSKRSRRTSDPIEPESTTNTFKDSRAEDDRTSGPFTAAVRGIQDRRHVLSTSPGVEFPLPPLLARLAAQEQKRLASASESSSLASSLETDSMSTLRAAPAAAPSSALRLTGVEKTGLGSVLGWEGREARGKGMVGVRGFVRHQALTVLRAEHVSPGMACGRARWVTVRYWARARADDAEADRTLGEVVERTCGMAEEPCETEGCNKLRREHTVSWTCAGVRICGALGEDAGAAGRDDITMWQSCSVCSQRTAPARMNDGTYLFSFAKFLELLLWSPALASLSFCTHTDVPPSLPAEARFHILHNFAWGGRVLTFSLSSIENEVFEIRVPRLQLVSGSVPKEEKQLEEARRKQDGEEERQVVFTEMDEWWRVFKMRLDRLDEFLQQEVKAAQEGKDLPPLPMSDDEDLDDDLSRSWLYDRIATPSPQRPEGSRTTSFASQIVSRPTTPRPKADKPSAAPYPPGLSVSVHQSRELLVKLRASFQGTEESVRKRAAEDAQLALNDVRRTFRTTARGAVRRLAAWQKKHAPGAPADGAGEREPEWWRGTCHAVPGGKVVVREGEWGSVIAFTLSSLDYQRELASLGSGTAVQTPSTPSTSVREQHSLAASPASTVKNTGGGGGAAPDPDDTAAAAFWEEAESCTAVIARREHPREMSALLSLRDVLRTKKSFEGAGGGSRLAGAAARGGIPPSAWTSPQVQVNLQSAGGLVSQFPEAAEEVGRVLGARSVAAPLVHHRAETTITSEEDMATPTASSFVERNIRSGKSASIISYAPGEGPEQFEHVERPGGTPSPLPPSPEPGSAASAFSSALSNAMRYFLSNGSPPASPAPSMAPHHGLLALETAPIDERPHIKYEWTIGRRLRFGCTVYYAKQFDALRRRCGVDAAMLRSLERTEGWAAVGGKSRSNFWKSADGRFVIKTLVNAWNVADLQVLIDLGPAYFRYIDSTANKPSVLAKLMGFYTVEIKNLETGTVQAKADLLVTENLFYNQTVARTFDLKGIQSRRVKPANGEAAETAERRTLFDGEWIDAQQRAPLLIQPHSKLVLHEAIRSDADFLARSNIMDYSLLLGIDEERHEIACGLVDTIGSYTFAKTLEYKAKQNLNSGKGREVTVLPPAEYQQRFVGAMESYFLACPDKWTKPARYVDRTTSRDLESVL